MDGIIDDLSRIMLNSTLDEANEKAREGLSIGIILTFIFNFHVTESLLAILPNPMLVFIPVSL